MLFGISRDQLEIQMQIPIQKMVGNVMAGVSDVGYTLLWIVDGCSESIGNAIVRAWDGK